MPHLALQRMLLPGVDVKTMNSGKVKSGLGKDALAQGGYDSIATFTVPSGGVTEIVFAGIPQGYEHLQIRGLDMVTYATDDQGYSSVQFNGDVSASYTRHQLTASGTAGPGGYGAGSITSGVIGFSSLASTRTSDFCINIIDIYDYSNPIKNTTVKSSSGMDFNGSGFIGIFSCTWVKTDPVTTIKLFSTNGSFRQNTTYSLYGLR